MISFERSAFAHFFRLSEAPKKSYLLKNKEGTKMITVKEAAEKLGVTPRRVQGLCKEGKIKGATRWERTWMIPHHAVLPSAAKIENPTMPMPRKSPFLDMPNIYSVPGKADESIMLFENNIEAHEHKKQKDTIKKNRRALAHRFFINRKILSYS